MKDYLKGTIELIRAKCHCLSNQSFLLMNSTLDNFDDFSIEQEIARYFDTVKKIKAPSEYGDHVKTGCQTGHWY